MRVMNSSRPHNPHGSLHTLRFKSPPAWAHANGRPPEFAVQARWSKTPPVLVAMPRPGKSFWLPLLAGLLAFSALAFGVFVAAGDTCTADEAGAEGNYSQSTLAPITAAGTDGARGGSCKREHEAGRLGHPKTVLQDAAAKALRRRPGR